MGFRRPVAAFSLLMFLGANSAAAVEAAKLEGITRIGLAPASKVDHYVVDDRKPRAASYNPLYGAAGSVGGIIGILLAAVAGWQDASEIQRGVVSIDGPLKKKNYDFSRELDKSLAEKLKAVGYEVMPVPYDGAASTLHASDIPDSARSKVDAIMAVEPRAVGYVASSAGAAMQPVAVLDIRLVSAKQGELLYQEQINALPDAENLLDQYQYSDTASLGSEIEQTAEGLTALAQFFAIHVAKQIQRPGYTVDPKRLTASLEKKDGTRKPVVTAAMAAAASAPAPRFGSMSYQIERMAKGDGCVPSEGAVLVSEPGPVESYRVQCEAGHVMSYKCQYRQCTAEK